MLTDQVVFVMIKSPQLGKILVNDFRHNEGISLIYGNHGTLELRNGVVSQLRFQELFLDEQLFEFGSKDGFQYFGSDIAGFFGQLVMGTIDKVGKLADKVFC
jgi:hypothetical protein